MFGIGAPEIIVVLIMCLLVFDVKRLPKIAKSLGRAIKEFRRAQRSFTENDSGDLAG